MVQTLDELDDLRRKRGVSQEKLAAAAGVSARHLSRLKNEPGYSVPPTLLRRCKRALSRLSGSPDELVKGGRDVLIVYMPVCALVAREMNVPMDIVRENPPAAKATQNEDWMRAARVREITTYLVNTAIGLQQVNIARALGVSQAAISKICRKIEEERDDNAQLELVVSTIERELDL